MLLGKVDEPFWLSKMLFCSSAAFQNNQNGRRKITEEHKFEMTPDS